ncbi:TetR/AcrR family transcriptional regulator C-terminal domain-containing protein [Yinghuangia sp. YIM S10712]|uniref:TetR/AcrR family transcriptional regulator C-terminal domain-containing protein n=1 Tax=Yinghuangia sp. YIM S10712 TaxID=3436930 RepID=UPI003F52B9E2
MATRTESGAEAQVPLSRERVLRTAVGVADAGGIKSLTMRNLAEALGVEAMSLYHHVDNKEAILDGLIDVVMGEIDAAVQSTGAPPAEDDWKTAMRMRILAAREVLLRHPWAPGVFETRTTTRPGVVRYINAVVGEFRAGGFSYDLAHHALHALGSRVLGFTQELFEPKATDGDDAENDDVLARMADELPYLVGMVAEVAHDDPDSTLGWCDDRFEFEFGLDLILDGLERIRTAA